MSSSIVQEETCCMVCYTNQNLERHHIFGGGLRKKSEEYGLTVWLCHNHHNENVKGNPGVHHSRELDLWLKKLGQQAFEREFPEKDFLREFGRSYR